MIARYCSINDLEYALKKVNEEFDDNIIFKREPEYMSRNSIRFTLTVKDSRGPGSRKSSSPFSPERRVSAACWHVHGLFFDCLFEINGEALIISRSDHRITAQGGNWEDWNAGSMTFPRYMSECCDCD